MAEWTWKEVGAALSLQPAHISELNDEMNRRGEEDMIDSATFISVFLVHLSSRDTSITPTADAERAAILQWIHGIYAVQGAQSAPVEDLAAGLSLFCSTANPRAVCGAVFSIFDIDGMNQLHQEEMEVYLHALLRMQAALAGTAGMDDEEQIRTHRRTAQTVARELFVSLGTVQIDIEAFTSWFLGGVQESANDLTHVVLSQRLDPSTPAQVVAEFQRWERLHALSALQVDELQERLVDAKVASRSDPMTSGMGSGEGIGQAMQPLEGAENEAVAALREELEKWNRCKVQSLLRVEALQEIIAGRGSVDEFAGAGGQGGPQSPLRISGALEAQLIRTPSAASVARDAGTSARRGGARRGAGGGTSPSFRSAYRPRRESVSSGFSFSTSRYTDT